MIAQPGWNTDTAGAHASCAVDGRGSQADLLVGVKAGEPLDDGFHVDTSGGSPAEALRNVMQQALAYLTASGVYNPRRAPQIGEYLT